MALHRWILLGLSCVAFRSVLISAVSTTEPTSDAPTTLPPPTTPEPLYCEPAKYNVSDQAPMSGDIPLVLKCPSVRAGDNPQIWIPWSYKNFSLHFLRSEDGKIILLLKYLTPFPQTNITFAVNIELTTRNVTRFTPIEIHMMDLNDPPQLEVLRRDVFEGQLDHWWIPVRDPDAYPWPSRNKSWGDITISETGMPPELQIVQVNRTHFLLQLITPLDAEDPRWTTVPREPRIDDFNSDGTIREYERPYRMPELFFRLKAKDGGGLAANSSVTIRIVDKNDNLPYCEPVQPILAPRNKSMISPYSPIIDLLRHCRDPDICRECKLDFRFWGNQECREAFQLTGYERYSKSLLLAGPNYPPENTAKCNVSIVVMDDDYASAASFEVIFLECPAEVDSHNISWSTGWPGKRTWNRCPGGYYGSVSRLCGMDGTYQPPFFNCTSPELEALAYQSRYSNNMSMVLEQLANVTSTGTTKQPLLAGEVTAVTSIMEVINDRIKTAGQVNTVQISNYLEVANNLMEDSSNKTWISIINNTGSGVDQVLNNIDRFIETALTVNASAGLKDTYAKSNFYLNFGHARNCQKNISFPDKTSRSTPLWAMDKYSSIFMPCGKDTEGASYSTVMYRDLRQIIPTWADSDKQTLNESLNSHVLSMSLFPKRKSPLEKPVSVTFQLYEKKAGYEPRCSYWNTGLTDADLQYSPNYYVEDNPGEYMLYDNIYFEQDTRRQVTGYWSSVGCVMTSYDADRGIVVCECNHLTNFAILMSPSPAATAEHLKALSVISLVGCIISMIFLVITFAVHVFYWRYVGGERTTLLLNLCVTLFLAYLVFLAGVDKVSNKDACTFVAVLLHFIYLVVFFTMLAIGSLLAKTVIKPFNKTPIAKWCLLASYGVAAIVVGTSMGATQLDGYGSSTSCWLAVSTGLIWAFVVPVLLVVVVNIVIIIIVLKQMYGTTAMSNKSVREKAVMGLRSIGILLPVLGVTWVLGVFSVNEDTIVFQYLFAIFNSIQGLLIFIFHCILNKKIKDAFRKSFKKVPLQDTISSDKKTPSTANTDI